MTEIHAKPIVDGKLWVVEQDGSKIATLHKHENNKFLLASKVGELWFNKQEDLINQFGSTFFLNKETINIDLLKQHECHGYPTKSIPYNAMYDVRRRLPLYTKQPSSKCFHCAGWYVVKFKTWVLASCPKLITIDRYEHHGPFKSKLTAYKFKCNIK